MVKGREYGHLGLNVSVSPIAGTVTTKSVAVARAGEIRGRLTVVGGAMRVWNVPVGTGRRGPGDAGYEGVVSSDPHGGYHFDNVPAGHYIMTAGRIRIGSKQFVSAPVYVNVASGVNTIAPDIVFREAACIRGKVVFSNATQPPSRVIVTIRGIRNTVVADCLAGDDGSFSAAVPSGDQYVVRAETGNSTSKPVTVTSQIGKSTMIRLTVADNQPVKLPPSVVWVQ